jgi:hypothetical protein
VILPLLHILPDGLQVHRPLDHLLRGLRWILVNQDKNLTRLRNIIARVKWFEKTKQKGYKTADGMARSGIFYVENTSLQNCNFWRKETINLLFEHKMWSGSETSIKTLKGIVSWDIDGLFMILSYSLDVGLFRLGFFFLILCFHIYMRLSLLIIP